MVSYGAYVSNINKVNPQTLVQGRIHKLKNCVNSRPKSVFKDQEAVKYLSSLHDKYVIVPADKASNNIVFVCFRVFFLKSTCDLCHYANKQLHNISVVSLLLQTESLSGE
jgi:hypothetical protein